jgi:hypothetical protein
MRRVQATRPDWSGRTVVCIASGPSLTEEDCETVRKSGHTTIVTNTTFRLAPWADVLFGFDSRWWRSHPEALEFAGRKISASRIAGNLGIETVFCSNWFRAFGNSGACAISLAVAGGAAKIVLLGFDCSIAPDGKRHWHGDHPKELSNCQSLSAWPKRFAMAAAEAKKAGVPVLNASRRTALTCFDRAELESAL